MDNLISYPPIPKAFQIGVDIGQQVDPTAIVVAELQLENYRRIHPTDRDEWQHGEVEGGEIHYEVRLIERLPLRTPYPKVIERLKVIYDATRAKAIFPVTEYQSIEAKIANRAPRKRPNLNFDVYLDATGVGRPIVDACEETGMIVNAVTLTSGEKETRDGREIRLSKQVLVSRMQLILQNKLVHLPTNPPEQVKLANDTANELLNYEIKVTDSRNIQAGVFKIGEHDDLATALGLACQPMRNHYITFGYSDDPNVQELAKLFGW